MNQRKRKGRIEAEIRTGIRKGDLIDDKGCIEDQGPGRYGR